MSGTFIELDSSQLEGQDPSKMRITFPYPITNPELKARLALVKFNGYYSTYNVTSANNTLYYDDGSAQTITIPPGIYTVEDMSNEIESQIGASTISFIPNYNTGKVYASIGASYSIDWTQSTGLGALLGFTSAMGTQSSSGYGNVIANVNNGVVSWKVTCSLCRGKSFINGASSDVVAQFQPRSPPYGSVDYEVLNLIYLPVQDEIIREMEVKITDQSGNELDFNGENVSILFHLSME